MLSRKRKIKYVKLKRSAFENFRFKKNMIFRYSTNYLISNYTHIGFKKNLTLHSFKKALLGFYSNIAIINPGLTLASLRLTLNFILKLALGGKKTCFGFFGFPEALDSTFLLRGNYYFLNCWIAGSFTNHFFAKKASIFKKRFFPYIPSSMTFFGYEPHIAVEIAKETEKVLIPSFAFIDSHVNPSHFMYWIPMNSKSGHTKVFFLNFVKSFVVRSFLLKKFNFFNRFAAEINSKKFITFKLTFKEFLKKTKERKEFLESIGTEPSIRDYYTKATHAIAEENARNEKIRQKKIEAFNKKFDAGFFRKKKGRLLS